MYSLLLLTLCCVSHAGDALSCACMIHTGLNECPRRGLREACVYIEQHTPENQKQGRPALEHKHPDSWMDVNLDQVSII